MSTAVEFKTAGYYSFAIEVEKVTVRAINEALEQAYLKMKVDPQYLFIPAQNHKALYMDICRYTNICIRSPHNDEGIVEPFKTIYINQTTGRVIRIVPLPDAEPNVIIFGFITH